MDSKRYRCACCGYQTLPFPSPSDDICPVCGWQDDFVDNQDTNVLGPNRVRLSIAQGNFEIYGASEARLADRTREPRDGEGPPEPWTETRDKAEL